MLHFLVKWSILIIIVLTIARTTMGRKIVSIGLWLIVLLLVVTHGKDIAGWLQ